MKNATVGRFTFIEPAQSLRQLGITPAKAQPAARDRRGKRLVVIDDSIVRGNTQRALVRITDLGSRLYHISLPVLWPCFFSIDTDAPLS